MLRAKRMCNLSILRTGTHLSLDIPTFAWVRRIPTRYQLLEIYYHFWLFLWTFLKKWLTGERKVRWNDCNLLDFPFKSNSVDTVIYNNFMGTNVNYWKLKCRWRGKEICKRKQRRILAKMHWCWAQSEDDDELSWEGDGKIPRINCRWKEVSRAGELIYVRRNYTKSIIFILMFDFNVIFMHQ